MPRIELTSAECDVLVALCEAASALAKLSKNSDGDPFEEWNDRDWDLAAHLIFKLDLPEEPPSHEMKLNW
jgi:hypothetical protein